MQKLNYNLREVWLGYHEEVGPFLYDKGSQSKLSEKVVTKENVGAAAGGVAGGIIGSSIGIAGFGTAIAGTLPVAIVGAALGYLGVKLWKNNKSKDDEI